MTSVFLKYPFHIFTIVCLIIHPLNKITLLLVRYLPTTNLVLNLVSNLDTVHQNQELNTLIILSQSNKIAIKTSKASE